MQNHELCSVNLLHKQLRPAQQRVLLFPGKVHRCAVGVLSISKPCTALALGRGGAIPRIPSELLEFQHCAEPPQQLLHCASLPFRLPFLDGSRFLVMKGFVHWYVPGELHGCIVGDRPTQLRRGCHHYHTITLYNYTTTLLRLSKFRFLVPRVTRLSARDPQTERGPVQHQHCSGGDLGIRKVHKGIRGVGSRQTRHLPHVSHHPRNVLIEHAGCEAVQTHTPDRSTLRHRRLHHHRHHTDTELTPTHKAPNILHLPLLALLALLAPPWPQLCPLHIMREQTRLCGAAVSHEVLAGRHVPIGSLLVSILTDKLTQLRVPVVDSTLTGWAEFGNSSAELSDWVSNIWDLSGSGTC
ncbi:hypothetical protein B484DRAFT_72266 [Ochromonadaceae sp. CCMP2298]|nr:hypothetical protein B484DRAFT_72266 [Ochromonadaceae sp. CCMP2298]